MLNKDLPSSGCRRAVGQSMFGLWQMEDIKKQRLLLTDSVQHFSTSLYTMAFRCSDLSLFYWSMTTSLIMFRYENKDNYYRGYCKILIEKREWAKAVECTLFLVWPLALGLICVLAGLLWLFVHIGVLFQRGGHQDGWRRCPLPTRRWMEAVLL